MSNERQIQNEIENSSGIGVRESGSDLVGFWRS